MVNSYEYNLSIRVVFIDIIQADNINKSKHYKKLQKLNNTAKFVTPVETT